MSRRRQDSPKNGNRETSTKASTELDADAWRRTPLFGEDPLKGIDVDILYMMKVALDPGLGVGNRRRILRAATAFSNAATAAFELSLETTTQRWNQIAIALHESLQTALAPSGEDDPDDFNIGWFVYTKMGLKLKDLLPDRSDDRPSDFFHISVGEFQSVEEFKKSEKFRTINRSSWGNKLTKYSPPSAWKRDPEAFLRIAENCRQIANKCQRGLPKRTRDDGRPGNPERLKLLKWVQAQRLEPEALSRQLKNWSRLLVTWTCPVDDMPPLADRRKVDGTWWYRTEADHAEAFAKWWDRRTKLTYTRMRDVLKDTEKDAKRAKHKSRSRQ
jgi:hypothetical protein